MCEGRGVRRRMYEWKIVRTCTIAMMEDVRRAREEEMAS